MKPLNIPLHEDPEQSCKSLVFLIQKEKDSAKKEILYQDFKTKLKLVRPDARLYYLARVMLSKFSEEDKHYFEELMKDEPSPKQKIDVAIITIIKPELDAAKIAFGIPLERREDKYIDGFRYWEFSHRNSEGINIKMVLTMVGKPRSNECINACNKLFGIYQVDLCILVGIAAGIEGILNLGDAVSATEIINYEGQRLEPTGPKKRPVSYSLERRIERDLLNYDPEKLQWHSRINPLIQANKLFNSDQNHYVSFSPNFKTCVILSGDKLLADGSLSTYREEYHDKALAFEMEGSGFASVCEEHSISWMVFRGISDFGDPKKPETDKFQTAYALTAAMASLMFVEYEYRMNENQEF